MGDKERFLSLLFKSSSVELSPEEQGEMWDLMSDPENQEYLDQVLKTYWEGYPFNEPVLSKDVQAKILSNIVNEGLPIDEQRVPRRFMSPFMIGVASLAAVLLLIFGIVFLRQDTLSGTSDVAEQHIASIEPGGNKAVLTLEDGSQVSLEGAGKDIIPGGKLISTHQEGRLVYTETVVSGGMGKPDRPQFHTVTTPKGGTYQVTLPDGTDVYLNSGSSIKYPIAFSKDIREVEVIGEIYFEVEKVFSEKTVHGRVPFVVHSGNQRIEVLGTQFNVNAYPDGKSIKTTLVEGSVKVHSKAIKGDGIEHTVQLSPGYQVVNDYRELTVRKADVNQAVAWKSGYFVFDDDNILEIMRQLALWYNIEVSYEGDMKGKRFGGIFKRSKSIFQIMENIEQTGSIHFKTEGRRVTVIAN